VCAAAVLDKSLPPFALAAAGAAVGCVGAATSSLSSPLEAPSASSSGENVASDVTYPRTGGSCAFTSIVNCLHQRLGAVRAQENAYLGGFLGFSPSLGRLEFLIPHRHLLLPCLKVAQVVLHFQGLCPDFSLQANAGTTVRVRHDDNRCVPQPPLLSAGFPHALTRKRDTAHDFVYVSPNLEQVALGTRKAGAGNAKACQAHRYWRLRASNFDRTDEFTMNTNAVSGEATCGQVAAGPDLCCNTRAMPWH